MGLKLLMHLSNTCGSDSTKQESMCLSGDTNGHLSTLRCMRKASAAHTISLKLKQKM